MPWSISTFYSIIMHILTFIHLFILLANPHLSLFCCFILILMLLLFFNSCAFIFREGVRQQVILAFNSDFNAISPLKFYIYSYDCCKHTRERITISSKWFVAWELDKLLCGACVFMHCIKSWNLFESPLSFAVIFSPFLPHKC